MKILFVTSKSLGGSGKYITVLAEALKHKGMLCDLLYFPLGISQDQEMEAAFNQAFSYPTRPSLSPLGCLRNSLFARKIINAGDYDVVHTHTSLGGLIGRIGAMLANKRTIFVGHTIHAYGADEFTPQPQKSIYWLIERCLDFITSGYVSPSGYMAEYGRRTKVIDTRKVTVIYNSLPLDPPPLSSPDDRRIKRSEINVTDDTCVFLFCGRLERQKGVDTLLQALSEVNKDRRFHLIVCGVGEDGEMLNALAKKLSLDARITWAGWQQDVKPFYAAADVYIMASRWESFGLVFLEAMNYGLPILSTDTQAIPEVVEDGVTGRLSPSGNSSALAKNITELIDNSDLRDSLGKAGGLRLKKHFQFRGFVDKHINWYVAGVKHENKKV